MRKFHRVGIVALAIALIGLGAVWAQDDEYEEQGYGGPRENQFAVSFGAGIVDTDLDSDIYYAADFRIRLGGRGSGNLEEGIIGYIEPEVGYWSMSQDAPGGKIDYSDLHVGVGLTGVIPTRAADLFMNVGLDLHSFDVSPSGSAIVNTVDSDSAFGGHARVGLDLYLGDNFSLFGSGGYYLVDTDIAVFENQVKVYIGGRFGF